VTDAVCRACGVSIEPQQLTQGEAHQMTERTELLRFLNHREALRRFHDWRAGYIATHMRRRRAAVVRRCAITVLSMTARVLSCSLRGRRIAASFAKRESDA